MCCFTQAVDVVGQAGIPKTITGFQSNTTPVLLAYGERADLATEEVLRWRQSLERISQGHREWMDTFTISTVFRVSSLPGQSTLLSAARGILLVFLMCSRLLLLNPEASLL